MRISHFVHGLGSILLLYFANTPGLMYVFAIIFGISLGGDCMIIPLMAAELFGVKVMGCVMGIILILTGSARLLDLCWQEFSATEAAAILQVLRY